MGVGYPASLVSARDWEARHRLKGLPHVRSDSVVRGYSPATGTKRAQTSLSQEFVRFVFPSCVQTSLRNGSPELQCPRCAPAVVGAEPERHSDGSKDRCETRPPSPYP